MDRYLLELNPETTKRLERLKSYPDEPYDRVINRLLDSFETRASLSREEVEEIRQALRDLREGRFGTPGQVMVGPAPASEKPPSSIGDPQAVLDMERIFSGAAKKLSDTELTPSDSPDTDPGDIHEIEDFDRRGRSRSPRLDSL